MRWGRRAAGGRRGGDCSDGRGKELVERRKKGRNWRMER
jgi:hypothetical protein